MKENLTLEEYILMLRNAAGLIREHHQELSKLDSYGGDGDHGTTMLRAMEKMEAVISKEDLTDFANLNKDIAWALMGVDGGATGPLFGAFFMGMTEGVEKKAYLSQGEVGRMFDLGLRMLEKQTQAKVGDKTLLDAMVPAVKKLVSSSDEGLGIETMFADAYKAAQEGSQATKEMQSRFGRAKNAGDKNKGYPDPGSVSVTYIFQGFLKGVE